MRVLITGAGGMLGRRLAARIAADGLGGRPVERLWRHDIVPPDGEGEALGGDLGDRAEAARLGALPADVVFHLGAVVSGEAEADFAKGYRVNLDGTRALFEAVAARGGARVVFASTLAVFGAPFPDTIPEDFAPRPLTSYGTQKLIGELLLSDLSRREMLDGVAVRLPTVCVRPGRPNRAASGFFSGIIREPLRGERALLPVPRETVHPLVSPDAAVGFLLHAAEMDTAPLGARRALSMPALSVSVGEMIAALERAGGDPRLIEERPDPVIAGIVAGWARAVEARRALELGFRADPDFDSIVAAHQAESAG
ncbi:NAD-dependent epimerase/dehydratase family protein [Rubellimicrobium sp. CFH 75288]|nr:SDR family oxidoreductase [Rubellimicrobium sp. CFH 75288]NAZ37254.1 NAD-dependent epimerase/dehydratase family protein [Rubellimicrobium sp. CFH 75288]